MNDISRALSEYQHLFDILKTHYESLPTDFQTKLAQWELESVPLIEKGKDALAQLSNSQSTTASSLNTSNTSDKSKSTLQSTAERYTPAQIQARKLAATGVYDTPILAWFLSKLQQYTTQKDTTLPLPFSTSHPELTSVAIDSLDWKSLLVKKAKNSNLWAYTSPLLLRASNTFLRSNPLSVTLPSVTSTGGLMQDADLHSQIISPIQLATLWAETFIAHLTIEVQNDIIRTQLTAEQLSPHPNSSELFYPIQTLLPFITFSQSTSPERNGSVDLFFDHKSFTQSLSLSLMAVEEMVDNISNELNTSCVNKKRKTTPLSSSPLITPLSTKPKQSNNDNDNDGPIASTSTSTSDVLLGEDKIFQDLSGLFDFTPTSGESRHCINPETKYLQNFQFTAMGYMNSCFRAKFTTPRQGNAVESSHAQLILHNDVRFHSLAGLEQYSHVWVVFVFHSNAQSSYRPKITPPRLGERVGCLATRSPHRWNDIGLSLVKLDRIEYPEDFAHLPISHPKRQFVVHTPGVNSLAKNLQGCARLIFSNVDLIDGTPILDIKPFNPGDLIPNPTALRFPDWLANAPMYTLDITFHKQVDIDLFNVFKSTYQNAHKLLLTHAKEWNETDKTVQSSNPVDVIAKKTHKDYFAVSRLDQIQQYLTIFESFTPESILDINTTAIISTNNDTSSITLTASQIQEYLSKELGSPLQFYNTVPQIRTALMETLRNDPRPIWTRFENRNRAIYGFLYDNLNVVYQMNGDTAATVCFAQLRDEYLRFNSLSASNDGNDPQHKELLTQKRGWTSLIKSKLATTIVDPTDQWAQELTIGK